MADFIPALKEGVKSAYCFALNNNRAIFGAFNRINPSPTIGSISNAISKFVCNQPEPDQPPPPNAISGGQCPGVRYNCTLTGNRGNDNQPFTQSFPNRLGPIRKVSPLDPPPTCSGMQVLNRWRFEDGSGGLLTQANTCSSFANNEAMTCTPVAGQVEPPGGCGDVPPVLPPPSNIPGTININYGDSNEFNLTTPIIFAPVYVALDGTINIPFTIEELNLVGELSLNGDLEISLNPGGNSPPNSGDGDPMGEPDPDGGEPDNEPEDNRGNIVGVFVVVTSLPINRATFIPQSAGPNIIAPRAGSVKFKVSANGRSGWSEDLPVKSSNAWIPVPGRILASDVQVTPDFGAELVFSVVREAPRSA